MQRIEELMICLRQLRGEMLRMSLYEEIPGAGGGGEGERLCQRSTYRGLYG